MVIPAVYLFLGDDSASKDLILERIKQQIFPRPSAITFNFESLHGRDASLKELQEKLLLLPVNAVRRMLVLRQAENSKEEIKKFLLSYCAKPHPSTVLVIDIHEAGYKDVFVAGISRHAAVRRFGERRKVTVFDLSRAIESRQPQAGLQILHALLREGEKPERILGALRANWERTVTVKQEMAGRLKLLLASDVDVKTGRLKPAFVLERLVVSLCSLRSPRS